MKTFPMFLQMAGRRVVIVGGGEQAAQKTRLMLKTEAKIMVLAPALEPELATLRRQGKITHDTSPPTSAHFADTALVFVATGCPGGDAAVHALAQSAGATVNVVDQPQLCDALTPSLVDRDPVVVAIGTEGTAPVLARQIKTQVEQMLEPRLGDLAAMAGRLRDAAAARLGPRARRDLWRWVFGGAPRLAHARGAERAAATLIKNAIATGQVQANAEGSVALVGAGPGSKDLITLRGVQRLQEADVIYYDRLLDTDILELARRDAERICVGKAPGHHHWPQEKITGTLVAAAKQGKRVVRLKCGDPGVFARGGEELAALKQHGIEVEIVPGVTAACAAAAATGHSLTERGKVDTLVLTTGHSSTGYVIPDALRCMQPGTCTALYMAVGAAEQIVGFMTQTYDTDCIETTVVAHAQRKDQTLFSCPLEALPQELKKRQIKDTAILFLSWPADAQQARDTDVTSLPDRIALTA